MKNPVRYSPRNVAMDYLSRREHSRAELKIKLNNKGFDEDDVTAVLDKLAVENLQNDARFAQSYIRYRSLKGIGPLKIHHELKQKGIAPELLKKAEQAEECDWYELLKRVAERKYGEETAKDLKEKQKRSRFLQQRGFVMHDIMRLLA